MERGSLPQRCFTLKMFVSLITKNKMFYVRLPQTCKLLSKVRNLKTACLVQWLARLPGIQEVLGSIPCYTLEIYLEVQGMEQGPPSLVRTTGQLLDTRSREIWLRKLKFRLRDKHFANHKAPCTAIWQQPLQSILALRGCSATDFLIIIRRRRLQPL